MSRSRLWIGWLLAVTLALAGGGIQAQQMADPNFNAAVECKEVTCLYNHVNWFIEDLIEHPDKLDRLQPSEDRKDFFL